MLNLCRALSSLISCSFTSFTKENLFSTSFFAFDNLGSWCGILGLMDEIERIEEADDLQNKKNAIKHSAIILQFDFNDLLILIILCIELVQRIHFGITKFASADTFCRKNKFKIYFKRNKFSHIKRNAELSMTFDDSDFKNEIFYKKLNPY
ncbi:hypothetical protein BpHYR1_037452 [Brachionus plicatilis]|uniref:Uncharacterized protein n=1 Tax=Brachionus plicatilis TaxID=10195 RepID=A0A3M7SFR7_BRAPC|nr:hypothetical protein BpHYR1_037452 [Brachionus plicatilis]